MSAAVIVLARRKKIIKDLKNAGAVSPETAISIEEIGVLKKHSLGILPERMVKKGLIKRTEDGRFYL